MARFQRRDDALGAAQVMKGAERLLVGDADVLGAADVVQVSVLGTDTGIVQTSADAVRLGDLAVVVLQYIGAVAMQYARAAALDGSRMLAAVDAFTGGFDADQLGGFVLNVGVKNAHRVTATPDAGNHRIGLRGLAVRLVQ